MLNTGRPSSFKSVFTAQCSVLSAHCSVLTAHIALDNLVQGQLCSVCIIYRSYIRSPVISVSNLPIDLHWFFQLSNICLESSHLFQMFPIQCKDQPSPSFMLNISSFKSFNLFRMLTICYESSHLFKMFPIHCNHAPDRRVLPWTSLAL